jgi:hypothetical protein
MAEPGVVHAKLGLADPDFAPCCAHPLLTHAATAVLGPDWHLAALSLRAPQPGCGHQGLHPGFEQRVIEGRWQTLSVMWCITAFTADDGPLRGCATRYVVTAFLVSRRHQRRLPLQPCREHLALPASGPGRDPVTARRAREPQLGRLTAHRGHGLLPGIRVVAGSRI